MPNHFHLLIYVNDDNVLRNDSGQMQIIHRKIGTLQSSYTRAINNQEGKVGPLFQSKFKAVELTPDHAITCFHYIHQNPVKGSLTNSLDEWAYCSYREYLGTDKFNICDKQKVYEYLGVPEDVDMFKVESLGVILNQETINKIKSKKSSDH